MKLFFVDDMSTGKAILCYLRADPDRFGLGPFFFALSLGESASRFSWPRLAWKDFPAIRDPLFAPCPSVPLAVGSHVVLHGAGAAEDDLVCVAQEIMRDAALNAKGLCIVCACVSSDTGAWAFAKAAQDLLGFQGFPVTPDLRITGLTDSALAESFSALEQGISTAARTTLYQSKVLQRRFEYNWWLNANALLRPVLSLAGLHDSRAPSKYELQLLYALRKREPSSVEAILGLMRTWAGTGKYTPLSLGSPKSRSPMIENLLRMGALETTDRLVSLSRGGSKLLDMLPKDCEDRDLPMRLLNWKAQPITSTPNVDTYLFKWFAKVKRLIDSQR